MSEGYEASSGGSAGGPAPRGPLVWFARNPIAANLVFVLLLVGGALSILRIDLEFFPEITPRLIVVQVPFPGGSPHEVEEGICRRIEEAVADIEGLRELRSTAMESLGLVVVKGTDRVDLDRLHDDVRRAVEQIETFPPEAEEPIISDVRLQLKVLDLVLYGDVPRRALKEVAEQIKENLVQSGQISLVEIIGAPPYEISIEVSRESLRRHGMTFGEVARAVRRESLDLPGGTVTSSERELTVRTVGQAYRAEAFAALPVRAMADGSVVRVGDVAEVVETFEDDELAVRFNGVPAAVLRVYRVEGEGAFNVASTVREYIEANRAALPAGMELAVFDDLTTLLRSRLGTLLRDGSIGLVLILLLLGTFLQPRLAFWSAMGLAMSFIGALLVLPLMDVTINMASLFAFILVLGIVVDDVIIVGENIYTHYHEGKTRLRASIDGVREVAQPVTMTILTTVIAFLPLMFVTGDAGQILRVVPIIVIATLTISLVHALFILGAQLAGTTSVQHARTTSEEKEEDPGRLTRLRRRIGRGMNDFASGRYRRTIQWAIRLRYFTVACAVALLLITIGYVAGGLIEWRFFLDVDASVMSARIEMSPGTPAERTAEVVEQMAAAMETLHEERVAAGLPALVRYIKMTTAAQPYAADIDELRGEAAEVKSAAGEVVVELVPWRDRDLSSYRLARMWRDRVEAMPGVRSIVFRGTAMDVGRPIDVRFSAEQFSDAVAAAEQLKTALAGFEGVHAIRDNHLRGLPEVQVLELTPAGRTLGLDRREVAEQVRAAFFGIEAQRVQRGRYDVRVQVRYDQRHRASVFNVSELDVLLPDGSQAPLNRVAVWEIGEGVGEIHRVDRRRVVSVRAEVDEGVTSANDINAVLRSEVLPPIVEQYPRVQWTMAGEQEEQAEALRQLRYGYALALLAIYAALAVQFRSYVQPAIIMSAVVFGTVGAVWGHVLLGLFRELPLSLVSIFGIVAVAGVVVNDSLLLIDLINRRRQEGGEVQDAVIEACVRRFRPVVLTTITTFLGLLPLMVGGGQAEVLIPMAVSLGFGVLVGTAITLILVPALYMIQEDARGLLTPIVGDLAAYDAGMGSV